MNVAVPPKKKPAGKPAAKGKGKPPPFVKKGGEDKKAPAKGGKKKPPPFKKK